MSAVTFILSLARKLLAKESKGITTIPNRMAVEQKAGEIAATLQNAGLPLNRADEFIKSEQDLTRILNMIESTPPVMKEVPSGIRSTKSAKVFDLEGKEIKNPKNIMGGKEVKETEAQIKTRLEKGNKEAAKNLRMKKIVDDAIDNMSPSLSGDTRTDAALVAEDMAESMGKVYDDLSQMERLDLYDQAYTGLSKIRFKGFKKPKDSDPEDMAQGGRAGFKSGSFLFKGAKKLGKKYKGSTLEALLENPKLLGTELSYEGIMELLRMGGMMQNGGRAGFFLGSANPRGLGLLRTILKYMSKTGQELDKFQGVDLSALDMLRFSNPKRFNKLLEDVRGKVNVKEGIMGTDSVRAMQQADREKRKAITAGVLEVAKDMKAKDIKIKRRIAEEAENTIIPKVKRQLMEGMGMSEEAAEKTARDMAEAAQNMRLTDDPPIITKEGILELENVLKNLETGGKKKRDLNANGGRIGYKIGGIDKARRAFLKAAAGITGGIAALKTGLLNIGKDVDTVKNLPPIKTPVTKLEGTTTEMPEWFPSFINKFRDEGKAENVFLQKKVAVSKAEYDQAAAEGKLKEGNYFMDPRTPEYIAKNPDHSLYNKLVDTDERIYTTYTNDKVPGVRVDDNDGNVDVMFENDYSQPVSINYTAPGKKGPETGRVDIFLEGEAKMETKPKGEFVANDVETYATDPDGGFDTEDVIADSLDDMMEGTTRQMEEYATGKKVKGISKGEGRVVEREIRAEQASDEAAEAEAEAAADAADEFASGGIARMLGE